MRREHQANIGSDGDDPMLEIALEHAAASRLDLGLLLLGVE